MQIYATLRTINNANICKVKNNYIIHVYTMNTPPPEVQSICDQFPSMSHCLFSVSDNEAHLCVCHSVFNTHFFLNLL